MKREKRNQNSKPNQQQQINVPLLRTGDRMHDRCFLQMSDIETALRGRKTLIKKDESDQQNETAEREVDGDFPCRTNTISSSPNSDKQECRNERELMKSVKEKQVD